MGPLTPIECSQLETLLAKIDAYRAAEAKPTAEERRLKTEQDRMAKQEAATAARLAELQSSLDEVTTRLEATIRQRNMKREYGFAGGTIMRRLNDYRASLTEGLPKMVGKVKPENLAEATELLFLNEFPELVSQPAAPAAATYDAVREEARLAEQREQTATAIINAGKLRRGEPIVNITDFRKDKP